MYVNWNEKFAVGIEKVDEEHQFLFAIINHLFGCYNDGCDREEIKIILKRLGDYAARHFRSEERLMKDSGYPELRDHIAQHNEFRQRIKRLSDEFTDKAEVDIFDTLNFMTDWLSYHTGYEDKKYARHYQETTQASVA